MGEAVALRPSESLALKDVGAGLFKSGLFPNAKNEYGAFAIVEYGHELGIPPMMALKNINIISGQLACNGQLMLSLAMARGVTYEVKKEEQDGAAILFKRNGFEPYLAEFNKADAEAAGLLGKDNWKKYPKDMYFWRAVAKGVRRIAPEAVMGLYTPDELSSGQYIDITEASAEAEKEKGKDKGDSDKGGNDSGVPMASEAQIKAIHTIITRKSPDADHTLFVNDALGLLGTDGELEHVSIETITKEMAKIIFDKFELLGWTKKAEGGK